MNYPLKGQLFQPSFFLLESCDITASFGHIVVYCSFPNDSMATGLQIIAQLSEEHKLYVGLTTNRQTPASFLVEENGTYQFTIFAISERRGILDSNVEYSVSYFVDLSVGVDTTTTAATATATTSAMSCSSPSPIIERDLPISK